MTLLKDKNILITAGSTRGYLDAVRYITNTSTGMLGSEIAIEAMSRGAVVTYIHGVDSRLPDIQGHTGIKSSQLRLVMIDTNKDMMEVLQGTLRKRRFDAVIHAMAVADYVPATSRPDKRSSKKDEWVVKLVKTPKIIAVIRDLWPEALLVGFKLEVNRTKEELLDIAGRFLKKNRADMIVANDYAEISHNRHVAYTVTGSGRISKPLKGKKAIAKGIVTYLERVLI